MTADCVAVFIATLLTVSQSCLLDGSDVVERERLQHANSFHSDERPSDAFEPVTNVRWYSSELPCKA